MVAGTIQVEMLESDIALLTLDLPDKSANVLSVRVLEELAAALDDLEQQAGLAGLIVRSGKPGTFIAGADLREFAASLDAPPEQITALCRRGQELFSRLSKGPWVSVAAIDGVCLGGGAELACWCDRRVMSDAAQTQIGFPEVKLGLFPAWGGTARAPRMIGLANAVELITTGEPLGTRAALAMGLADDVASADQLVAAAVRLVRDEQRTQRYLRDRQLWQESVAIDETELGFLGATASAAIRQQTKGQYPAPLIALELMLEAAGDDVWQACQLEARQLPKLFGSPINRALLNVFFLTDRIKKDRGVDGPPVAAREIRSVGVIGAGIMGRGIAAANIKRGVPVVVTDASADALAAGASEILREVAYRKETGRADVDRAVELAPLLNTCRADQELAGCDLVVEAVVENAEVKRKVLRRIEPLLGGEAVLASNTSTITISSLAAGLQRPEQFCGIHFFNPVRQMQLVEIIRGQQTSDQTVATAVAYAKRVGKLPIVVHDGPGFLVNRLLFPYMNESLELVCAGVPLEQIEKAAKSFGMPMGPLTLYDVVGLDTAFYAGRTMWEAFPDRIVASPLLPAMVKAGRLGQKSGAGFFRYDPGQKQGRADPEFQVLADRYTRERREYSLEQITMRLFLPMLLEATRILQERIVRDARDIDLGLIYGLGFPAFRGGLLFWADTEGAERILEWLRPFEGLGTRLQPTELLREMAASGGKFYQQTRRAT